MTDRDSKQAFLHSLLETDPPVSEQAFREYRTMLEQKLSGAEKKFRRGRTWTKWMWIATVALVVPGYVVAASTAVPVVVRPFGGTVLVIGIGLFYLSVLRTIVHIVFERYAFESAHNEFRDAALLELMRKVEALEKHVVARPPA